MVKLFSLFKRIGIRNTLRFVVLRWLKLEHIAAEVETQYYFLNQSIDITKIRPASDMNLRYLQLCDAELLRIVRDYLESNNLRYWLDFGTLLGAIRHKGCIPWDDDIDIAMPRKDYEQFISKASSFFCQLGIELKVCQFWVGLGYNHSSTGIWIDIFPYDVYYSDDEEFAKMELKQAIKRRSPISQKGKTKYYYLANDDASILRFHRASTIFPCKQGTYEGYCFAIPNDNSLYLKTIYGDYMSLPKSGVLHHSINGTELYNLHKQSGVDLGSVLNELKGKGF